MNNTPLNKIGFTKIYDFVLSNSKLTSSQKLLISYVLGWQDSGKICFESNKTLAKRFGLNLSTIKKQITQLNKFDFFSSKENSAVNQFGKWSNSKEMKVDINALVSFLISKNEEVKVTDSSMLQETDSVVLEKTDSSVLEETDSSVLRETDSSVLRDENITFDTLEEFSFYVDGITADKISIETKKQRFDMLGQYGQLRNKENIGRIF